MWDQPIDTLHLSAPLAVDLIHRTHRRGCRGSDRFAITRPLQENVFVGLTRVVYHDLTFPPLRRNPEEDSRWLRIWAVRPWPFFLLVGAS
jgi:hypothetical protein